MYLEITGAANSPNRSITRVEQFGEESRKRVVGGIVGVVEGVTTDTPLHKGGNRSGRGTITAIATATVTAIATIIVVAVTGVGVVELGEGVELSEVREEIRRRRR